MASGILRNSGRKEKAMNLILKTVGLFFTALLSIIYFLGVIFSPVWGFTYLQNHSCPRWFGACDNDLLHQIIGYSIVFFLPTTFVMLLIGISDVEEKEKP